MTDRMPSVSLAAVPGRRARALEMAVAIEDRGFSGVYCPSFGDAMGLCLSIAHVTDELRVGTSIQPIYLQHPVALATAAGYLHEVSDGRFRLGVGVTHGPVIRRLQIETGKPLSDMREYVTTMRTAAEQVGGLPPLDLATLRDKMVRLSVEIGKPLSDMREYVTTMRTAAEQVGGLPPLDLATLRDKMVRLSVEIGDGAVWANASRSRMAHSLSLVPAERLTGGFRIGNMIPTVIDDDLDAARARNRTTLRGYVALPNYRNYWFDAGYEEEMTAAKAAIDARDDDAVLAAMSDEWLDDCTLSGPVGRVRDGIEAWFDAGVTNPIIVPSSTGGGQAKALEELFAAFA